MSPESLYYATVIGTVAFLAGAAAGWLMAVSWAARRYRYVQPAEMHWGET